MISQIPSENEGVFSGGNADDNRRLIEQKSVKGLILNHSGNRRDSLYERDSSLNQVLCKLAKNKGVVFFIDLGEFLKEDNLKSRAKVLSRFIQNIFLFNKFGNEVRVVVPKGMSKEDVRALLTVLGMPTDMIKKALN